MELVTTVAARRGLDLRLVELIERSGRGQADTVFEVARAARARGAPIEKVIRHECRHDEGIGDCTNAPRLEA